MNKILYHSSPTLIKDFLEPRPSGVIDGERAVFASSLKFVSMLFLAKWTDRDLAFGNMGGIWAVIEMRPRAIQEIFKGKSGYVYTVSAEGFDTDPRLGLKVEFINRGVVKIIDTEYIPDVWAALQSCPIVFINFDKYLDMLRSLVASEHKKMTRQTRAKPSSRRSTKSRSGTKK